MLYKILRAMDPAPDQLLALLGLSREEVGRFRGCFLHEGPEGEAQIVVHTRLGGGNRDCWCAEGEEHHCYASSIAFLQEHADYLYDEDNAGDCTYADFVYRVPPIAHAYLMQVAPGDRWEAFQALLERKAGV